MHTLVRLIKINLVICLIGFHGGPQAWGNASPKFNDVTILIPSCDKYADLWDPFFTLLFKHWPSLNTINKDIPIILISNKKPLGNPRITNVMIPNEISWSDNMEAALKQVKTQKVLIILEDYFITFLNERRLFEILKLFDQDTISYIQISHPDRHLATGGPYEKDKSIYYKGRFAPYRPSLQACIFRTKTLKFLLKPGENPWQFERDGNLRSQGMEGKFLTVLDDIPLKYMNMSYQGHLSKAYAQQAAEMGANINNSSFPYIEDHRIYLRLAPVFTAVKNTAADIWTKIKNRF